MFCIKRTYTVYHNENQRKEQSYAATAGLYEGYDVCNAAFSAYIAYIVPSAVAFYWIVSSLVSLVQSVIVGKLFSPQRMTATSEARHAALMFEQEALVQYNYVPHGLSESAEENTNSKKKKKK